MIIPNEDQAVMRGREDPKGIRLSLHGGGSRQRSGTPSSYSPSPRGRILIAPGKYFLHEISGFQDCMQNVELREAPLPEDQDSATDGNTSGAHHPQSAHVGKCCSKFSRHFFTVYLGFVTLRIQGRPCRFTIRHDKSGSRIRELTGLARPGFRMVAEVDTVLGEGTGLMVNLYAFAREIPAGILYVHVPGTCREILRKRYFQESMFDLRSAWTASGLEPPPEKDPAKDGASSPEGDTDGPEEVEAGAGTWTGGSAAMAPWLSSDAGGSSHHPEEPLEDIDSSALLEFFADPTCVSLEEAEARIHGTTSGAGKPAQIRDRSGEGDDPDPQQSLMDLIEADPGAPVPEIRSPGMPGRRYTWGDRTSISRSGTEAKTGSDAETSSSWGSDTGENSDTKFSPPDSAATVPESNSASGSVSASASGSNTGISDSAPWPLDAPADLTADQQKDNLGCRLNINIDGGSYFVFALPDDKDFADQTEEGKDKDGKDAEGRDDPWSRRDRDPRKDGSNQEPRQQDGEHHWHRDRYEHQKPDHRRPGSSDDAGDPDPAGKTGAGSFPDNGADQKSDENFIPEFLARTLRKPRDLEVSMDDDSRLLTVISPEMRLPVFISRITEPGELLPREELELRHALLAPSITPRRLGLARGLVYLTPDPVPEALAASPCAAVPAALRNLLLSSASYLRSWDLYSDYEIFFAAAKLKGFKAPQIDAVIPVNGGYQLALDRSMDILNMGEDEEILFSQDEPDFLSAEILEDGKIEHGRLSEYVKKTSKRMTADRITMGRHNRYTFRKPRTKTRFQRIIQVSCPEGTDKPEKGLFVYPSLSGSFKMQERRQRARDSILGGSCANPVLGMLLEDGMSADSGIRMENLIQGCPRNRVAPLSRRIIEKIFPKNPPTPTQTEAISIALNTPDIALIQGPPGTGKTTVITAIIERISELLGREKARGQILVSGFQHDAVENIMERLSVNSLPAVKFGSRGTKDEKKSNQTEERITRWAWDLAAKIREKNPVVNETEACRRWKKLFATYKNYPSSFNAEALLRAVLDSPSRILAGQAKLIETARELLRSGSAALEESNPLLDAVCRLRCTKSSFPDDGPRRCQDLLNLVRLSSEGGDLLTGPDRDLLQNAQSRFEYDPTATLKELKELRRRLMLLLLPRPEFTSPRPRRQILELASEVTRILEQEGDTPANQEARILSDFILDLESSPESVSETVREYQLVYAATTQQSAGEAIARAKLGDDDKGGTDYDTVIIDEAARANPSDLLIPMAMARNRIILVGDHRQLPHMVEDEILNQINANHKVDPEFFRISMFQYLFHRLKKLEETDGIRRTVTLDAQYRTHPALGEYVSRFFYERHDPSEAYQSPLPASLFAQSLRGLNVNGHSLCCAWFDVGRGFPGTAKDERGSSFRRAEAEYCVKCLKMWIDTEAAKDLSFGIITFYRGQVTEILRQMTQEGYAVQSSSGDYEIAPEYRRFQNGRERLRVGTVDAFQGKEFDIVLLSVVRTVSPEEIRATENSDLSEEKKMQKVAGFLTVENRLCVSMSRQKRFLGILGDAEFIRSELVRKSVPSLAGFYDLCCDPRFGRVVTCHPETSTTVRGGSHV